MIDKQLADKGIDIQGKKYVQVKDRVVYFNDTFPQGSISTEVLSDIDGRVVIKATVTPDVAVPARIFTGISASNPLKSIEKASAHEVAETSAVGRALAFIGIGVIESIASADEMRKATLAPTVAPKEPTREVPGQMPIAQLDEGLTAQCQVPEHDRAQMTQKISKKTGKPYWSHAVDGSLCFGKGVMFK